MFHIPGVGARNWTTPLHLSITKSLPRGGCWRDEWRAWANPSLCEIEETAFRHEAIVPFGPQSCFLGTIHRVQRRGATRPQCFNIPDDHIPGTMEASSLLPGTVSPVSVTCRVRDGPTIEDTPVKWNSDAVEISQ